MLIKRCEINMAESTKAGIKKIVQGNWNEWIRFYALLYNVCGFG